jgi:glycosyltransferase involved in cell wall biosynthesis
MKALLICCGPEDYAIAVLNGLAPHVDVTAIVPRKNFAPLCEWVDPRLRIDLVEWPRTRSLSNPAFLWSLRRRIRAHAPDVLHFLSNTTLWLNAGMPFWHDLPIITTVHDVSLHPGDRETARLPGWGARLMARQSDHLVVHGEGLRAAAMERFGKQADNVHVVQHPAIRRYADLAAREGMRRRRPKDEFVVLLFGRIFAYKGLETLVRAEAALRDATPGLRVVIAGRGDDPMTFRSLMGRPERYDVRHGFVEDRDVAQHFVDADIVVLPYSEASQSGVLHLAATFGKPIVATDVGELRATVEPNGIGVVVPPDDPAALAQAIAALAERPDERERLGRNALAWSEGANAPAAIGRETAALYRKIVQRSQMPRPN